MSAPDPIPATTALDPIAVAAAIRAWGAELGFAQIAITDIDTAAHAQHLQDWLAKNFHGEMAYMAAHGAKRWQPDALEQLIPLLHHELSATARRYMRRERPDHALQPTALVNETFVRLMGVRQVRWQDRAHFLALAARRAP